MFGKCNDETVFGALGPQVQIKEEKDIYDISDVTIKKEVEEAIEFDIKIDYPEIKVENTGDIQKEEEKPTDFTEAVNQDAKNVLPKVKSSPVKTGRGTHKKIPGENSSLMCKKCFLIFQSKEDLIKHKDSHSETVFQCPDCHEVFDQLLSLNCHRSMHRKDEKQFKCDICNKSISCKRNLKEHMLMHFGELPYQCDHCKNFYRSKRSLAKHIRYHTFPRKYECPVCKKPFLQPASLKSHLRVHKSIQSMKKYECKICNAPFVFLSSLRKHVQSHDKTKEHQCKICGKRYAHITSFKDHVKSHEGVRYPCNICPKVFKHKSSVTFHKQSIHYGLRPFKCEECGKEFTRPGYLKLHMKSHDVVRTPKITKIFDESNTEVGKTML